MVTDGQMPGGNWGLDARYAPATQDSGIVVRFMGNCARIVDVAFLGQVDAGQMRYLAGWLKRQADKLEAGAEQKAAQEHILTPTGLPPLPPMPPWGGR